MEHVPPAERRCPRLERQAEALGDLPFLQVGELAGARRDARRGRAAGGLSRAVGIVAGDRVAIMAENRAEIVDAWFAASWLGAILVPFNTAPRGPQLAHVIVDSGPRVFAVDPELLRQLDAVELLPPELERIWLLGADGGGTHRGLPVDRFPEPGEPVPPSRCVPATRPRSLTPLARPAPRRVSAARRPSSTGGRTAPWPCSAA
jgi:crotonobetaine/carnitine-CoA ligase